MNKTEITDKVEKDLLNYFGAKTLLSNNKKLMEICIESTLKAINYSQCSTQLPDELEPVLAKIEHVNDLGKSSWYEVIFNDGSWRSYQGSKTFEDGEKVVKWKYCKAIV
jgi:hypothetical protein